MYLQLSFIEHRLVIRRLFPACSVFLMAPDLDFTSIYLYMELQVSEMKC